LEPVSLVIGALAAGAANGVGDTASTVVKDAYAALKSAIAARLGRKPAAEAELARHARDPDTYEESLRRHLLDARVADDRRIVELAQTLLRLTDETGFMAGKYEVNLPGAKGTQVGDHNTQFNRFD
jgi:hypothetical protein